MLKRAAGIWALTLLLSLAGSPAWVLAFCPTLHATSAHACCPMHPSTPAQHCIAQCAAVSAPAVKAYPAHVAPPPSAPVLAALASQRVLFRAEAAPFDDSGLWLRDRVLRI